MSCFLLTTTNNIDTEARNLLETPETSVLQVLQTPHNSADLYCAHIAGWVCVPLWAKSLALFLEKVQCETSPAHWLSSRPAPPDRALLLSNTLADQLIPRQRL